MPQTIQTAESELNRFNILCPDCKEGHNSKPDGGNERCFHCDLCGYIECFCPYKED